MVMEVEFRKKTENESTFRYSKSLTEEGDNWNQYTVFQELKPCVIRSDN